MKWSVSLALLLLVLLLTGTHHPPMVAATPPPGSDLAAQVAANGTLPVIVGLNLPFKPEGSLQAPQAVEDQQTAITQMQNDVLARLAGLSVSNVKPFAHIPYMAMTIDTAALDVLNHDPSVSSIMEDRLLQPLLDDSTTIVGANVAWKAGYTGNDWTIAILDSGIDADHPFLQGKVVEEACFSSNNESLETTSLCPNGRDEQIGQGAAINCKSDEISICQHGTHVAGIAAGKGEEFSGIANDATIIAVQVFSRGMCPTSSGKSSPCIVNFTSDLILGMQRVYQLRRDYNIAAINLSLGGLASDGSVYTDEQSCDEDGFALKAMVETLRLADIVTIASAGNDSQADGLEIPACLSNVVSVGATDNDDNVMDFSNSAPFLDFLAPGESITSSVPGGGFGSISGTSQATPHVSGAWTVLKACKPGATIESIFAILDAHAPLIRDSRNDVEVPRVQLDSALDAFGCSPVAPQPPAAPSNLVATLLQDRVLLSWSDNSTREDEFIIERSQNGSNWQQLARVGSNMDTYTDTGIGCGTTSVYRVYASNANDTSDYSNTSSVTSAPCIPLGDCNADLSLDASDLSALVLELAEARFGNSSCDANQDNLITAEDLDCTVQRIFGQPCAALPPQNPGVPTALPALPDTRAPQPQASIPTLTIPNKQPAMSSSLVQVPIMFDSGGHPLSSVAFSIEYDETLLNFVALDTAALPAEFQPPFLAHEQAAGTLHIAVTDRTDPLTTLPNGMVATVTFSVNPVLRDTLTSVDFSTVQPASFGNTDGLPVNGATFNGSLQIAPTSAIRHLFLPLLPAAPAPVSR
jgi:subtilisin family serine protease